MKKLFLFAASMLLAVNLFAQTPTVEDFNLQINNVAVTLSNADNVFAGVEGLDGKVRFDAENKTLILNNALIPGPIVVKPNSDELANEFYIHVIGQCSVTSNDGTAGAVYAQVENLRIFSLEADKGEFKAYASHNIYPVKGIKVYRSGAKNLFISGLSLMARSNNDQAIEAADVKISESSLIFAETEAAGKNAFSAPTNIALDNEELAYPSSAAVPEGQMIIIAPEGSMAATYQGVKVKGVPVTAYNAFDVLEDGSMNVSWEPTLGMLVLDAKEMKAYITDVPDGVPAVEFEREATVCLLKAPWGIYAGNNAPAIKTNSNLTFIGEDFGGIYGIGSHPSVIDILPGDEDVTLTFDKVDVNISSADQFSIRRDGPGEGKVHIVAKSSKVILDNVSGIEDITFEKCNFVYDPSISYYIIKDGQIWDENTSSPALTPIEIDVEKYPVKIDYTTIDAFNFTDVLGDGLVSYDPEKQILTIKDGANIGGTMSNPVIDVEGIDLTIEFDGEVDLSALYGNAIKFNPGNPGHKLTLIAKEQYKHVYLTTWNKSSEPIHGILDAYGNDVEFKGPGAFSLQAIGNDDNSSHLVWANTMTINAILDISTEFDALGMDILNVENIVLNENMEVGGSDYKLEGGKIVWADSKTDPIIGPIYFDIKDLGAWLGVAGVPVTMMNKDDILGNGKVSYDPATSTLTLDHVTIDGIPAYTSGIEWSTSSTPLTILVKGNCEINNVGQSYIMDIHGSVLFAGEGEGKHSHLTLVNSDAEGLSPYGVYIEGDFMRLLNGIAMEISVTNTDGPALWISGGDARLEVDNGDLRVATELSAATAIRCEGFSVGEGVNFRTDDATWPLASWDGGSMDFISSNPTHIWIGKHEEFPLPMDVENLTVPADKAVKVLYNGQIFILRGEKMYSITGVEVK